MKDATVWNDDKKEKGRKHNKGMPKIAEKINKNLTTVLSCPGKRVHIF